MGPTYLVLLRGDRQMMLLYEGKVEAEARAIFDAAYREQRDRHAGSCTACASAIHNALHGEKPMGVYLTTVRAEARLS